MIRILTGISLFIILLMVATACFGQKSPKPAPKVHPDDLLYENSFMIHGKVEILNHPALGRTPGLFERFLLQRVGCRSCLVWVAADNEGNYRVSVSKGKYRLIHRDVRGGGYPSSDLLSPTQRRIIDATKGDWKKRVDIEIVLPMDD